MLCVCNPITREVIKLDLPSDPQKSVLEETSTIGFVNGNLHWLATLKVPWISCFDVETECFSFFKAPPYQAQGLPFVRGRSISALSGCLWFCKEASEYENGGGRRELTIWIMKEYGVDESWSMEYVIPISVGMSFFHPIKVFENGDLLMLATVKFSRRLFYYSNKNKTMQRIDLFGDERAEFGLFTPTLVSLKTLGLGVENVIKF